MLPIPNTLSSTILRTKKVVVAKNKVRHRTIPHITLYLARYSRKGYAQLVKKLAREELRGATMRLQMLAVEHRSSGPYLYFVIGKTSDLMALHRKVVLLSNEFRPPMLRRKLAADLAAGACQKQIASYVQKYGSDLVMGNFHPHITIGTVESREALKNLASIIRELKRLEGRVFSPQYMEVGLFKKCKDVRKNAIIAQTKIKLPNIYKRKATQKSGGMAGGGLERPLGRI